MKYPILYAKNETDFFSLGLGVMTNTLEASVTEERNGSFYFESKIIIDVVIYPQLENDQLIKVDAGHELKDQRFRIKRIVDNHNGTASIYAEHISYLSAELSLKPEVTVSGNGSTALTIWKSSLIGANSFVVDSDITTSNSTKWRIDKVQNARQALGGVEGSILEKWGGEYRFDNYHISLLSKRGTTADVLLAYGRNITDFEQERNIANTFNSVYPFAIYTDDKQQEHLITLSGYFVDSSNIASFPNRKAQTVDFSNEFEHDVVPTQDKLKSLAQKYITTNGIGVPSVSIKVSFVDLSKISDYENIAPLEQLNLCDEVHVVYPKLKVNTTAKVVRVVWNVLAESYDEIEIGEKRVSLSDKISEQTKFINEVKTGANAALVSANGKNTNFYGLFGQDGNGEPKATKVGDLWYKPNGDKSELYQWNGTVWSFIISNDWQEIFNAKLTEELTKSKVELDAALLEKDIALAGLDEKIADELVVIDTSVKKAQADANTATTRADDAVDKANASVTAVQANTQLINDVNAIANTAKTNAQTAMNNAQTAVSNAGTAMSNSQAAITDAQTALDNYKNMVIGGTNILVTTTDDKTFQGNGAENQWGILSQLTKSKLADYNLKVGDKVSFSATCEISGSNFSGILTPRLRTAWTNLTQDYKVYAITKAEKIYFKSTFVVTESRLANGTGVDFRADNVPSTVNMKWSEIQLEIGDKPTTYAPAPDEISVEITNINGQLNQKVGQTSFDILNGTVANQATQINQNKNDIELRATKTDVNTLTGRVTSAEGSITTMAGQVALKANKSEVDTLSGKVSTAEGSITAMAGQIKLKANQTDVDTVKGRVTSAEGSISTMAGQIALKANQADVNTTNGKVSSLESSFTVQSGQISALNTKTDGQTTQIGGLQSSYDGLTSTVSSTVTGITNNSLISTQMIKDTTLKHPNYPDMPMVEVPVTNGETYTVSSNIPNSGTAAAAIAFIFYLRTLDMPPNSNGNGAFAGNSVTLPALSDKIYICFKEQSVADMVASGQYWVKVEVTPVSQIKVSQLSQDLSGFKTTVANTYLSKSDASGTYADKVLVASQITQSATAVTSNVQTWTNNKLTAYSTTQQTSSSITNAVADKADKSQVTQLSNQITSTVTGITNESLFSTQMISSTTLKHPNYPDMPMVGIPVTYGESYTVSSNIPNRGAAEVAIADVWYLRTPETIPNSNINGVFEGNSVTFTALYKIYIVFRSQSVADKVESGQYWVKATKTPASQSQITQLVNDINLRVTKNSVVNQINISPESILIAGNKIQITGQTYIENGVIENAKIKDLSASKLTAGTIDASLINVTKINASNITTGTLNADRIAANSITSTHINVSSLSALSANLGTVTAGTINAATVNIININAGSITTGVLSADRIGANSITSDKIKATSLELFSDDTHLKIMSNGIRFQSKAQLRFGPWIQVDGKATSTEGLYLGGWGNASSVKHIAFTRSDGSTFMMRAEDGMDRGTNGNISINDLNVFDSTHFWQGVRIHGNLLTDSYIVMGGSVSEASIQYDRGNKTMSFRIPGGHSDGSSYWFNNKITSADGFASSSLLSLKNIKGAYEGNALEDICQTEIMEYQFKNNPNDRQLSPIIDDINEIKKYHLPDIINDGKTVNLYAMNSLSWLAIKQLAQKLENIEEKLDAIA